MLLRCKIEDMNLTRNKWAWKYGVVALFAVAPLVAMAIGFFLAPVLGCNAEALNEAVAPDCPGGELVSLLFVSSWYALITLPMGGAALALLGLIHLFSWYRSRKATSAHGEES